MSDKPVHYYTYKGGWNTDTPWVKILCTGGRVPYEKSTWRDMPSKSAPVTTSIRRVTCPECLEKRRAMLLRELELAGTDKTDSP